MSAEHSRAPFLPSDYLRRKWREDVTDPRTGLGLEALKAEARRLAAELKGREPWPVVKARLFAMVCDRMSIGVSAKDFFPAFAVWSRKDRVLTGIIKDRMAEIDATVCADAMRRARELPGHVLRHDYDHAVPDWEEALRLGFPGLRGRLDDSGARNAFTEAMRIAADAMLSCLGRIEACARACADRDDARVKALADALAQLRKGLPTTVYEVLLFQLLLFVFGEHVDHLQVRSLGNLDRMLAPYYARDLAAGRLTREGFAQLLRHFFWQWGSIDNWWGQPFYLGGTKADGTTEYNEVSRIILDVIDELDLPTPKLQLKVAANTPDDVLAKALDMSRRHRSLVYCGEAPMARTLGAMGFSAEEARTCELWGCYEAQPRARANTTLPACVNMVRIVSDILARARRGAFDAGSFAELKAAYLAELADRVDRMLDIVRELEAQMDEIVPALVHSLTIGRCVKFGENALGRGMDYNLAEILQAGAGTAVDALAAIDEIVYVRREMSLAALGEAMAADWKGHETLRLRMLASRRKWGNNDPFTNALMREIFAAFGARVNGKPNSRGGKFFASGHSIDFFQILAKWEDATPDGRRKGDEFSKNISSAPGADRAGATALVDSIRAIDSRDIPGDVILDVTVHPSAVAGEKGLLALRALVEEYFAAGGCSIHFNVFGAEELRDAQAHPERYENLQVRVCGWNVRWNDLSRREQDAYIRRAEAQAQ